MNRKIIALAGTLILGGATVTFCAPHIQAAHGAVNSQKEFDKAFASSKDVKALNTAGHAYDNQNSRLFWFTDLEAAKKQAKAEGKPILSLKLLGKLSDEYSCANSRFFRVLLYPNAQINPILRDKFILHWSSERPVPMVTIDFGDGRKIKQTLTGNSAHYILDDTGRPLDVLPGLYSPRAFEEWLVAGSQLAANWKAESGETREDTLKKWHESRISAIWSEQQGTGSNEKWVQKQTEQSLKSNPFVVAEPQEVVDAGVAAPLAVSKVAIESPVLNATNLFPSASRVQMRDWIWGNPTANEVKLDDETKARIKAMNPRLNASPITSGTRIARNPNVRLAQLQTPTSRVASAQPAVKVEPFDALIQKLEESVGTDTAANKFRMEIPIHALFARGEEGDFTSLNRKIYDTLFLTPKSDPYLGLGADGVFTGLQNGGIIQTAPPQ